MNSTLVIIFCPKQQQARNWLNIANRNIKFKILMFIEDSLWLDVINKEEDIDIPLIRH